MIIDNKNQSWRNGNVALGTVLIILGGLFLLGQLFDIEVGRFVWPFFIIVPGVLLFVFSLVTGGSTGEGLAVVGSMVTTTGALLLYQNTFNHFESWAYAWALVVPASIGLGQMVYGLQKGRQHLVQTGQRLAMIGGVIFLAGVIFFELIIGISGFGLDSLGLGGYAWAILLVGLGIFFILRSWRPGASARPTPTPAESADSTQQLAHLRERLDDGLISEAKYQTKRAEMLSRM